MNFPLCRTLAAALLLTGLPATGRSALQQQLALADIQDSLLHREIAALGAYPEVEGILPEAGLQEVPLRSCSGDHAELSGAGVRIELVMSPAMDPMLSVSVDDSLLAVPVWALDGLAGGRFCGWDPGLQRALPYCSAARSADGARVYVHLMIGGERAWRLVTWVFEAGRYRLRVDEEAVL